MTGQQQLSSDMFPQPHEGVTGVDRDDFLLSLDEPAQTHRDLIVGLTLNMYAAIQSSGRSRSQYAQEILDRMNTPVAGDLVVEESVRSRAPWERRRRSFGVLLLHRKEWAHSDEEWEAAVADGEFGPDDDRWTHTAWYVQYGPNAGDVCRWTDCRFVAVLHDQAQYGVRAMLARATSR